MKIGKYESEDPVIDVLRGIEGVRCLNQLHAGLDAMQKGGQQQFDPQTAAFIHWLYTHKRFTIAEAAQFDKDYKAGKYN